MKKTLLTLIGTVALIANASASTVSLSKGLNPGFNVQSDAGILLSNFTILVGSFDVNPVAPTAIVLQALLQTEAFNQFGQATAPATGLITASLTKNDFSTGPAATEFNGRNIYAVVMNAATAALSTEFGLMTLDSTSTAGTWVFPADVTSALVTTNAPTGLLTNFATVVGTEIDNATGPESLRLAAIPEPSSIGLLSVLLGLGIARRRR